MEESVATAVGTAGSAVVFAGATVIVALCRPERGRHSLPDARWAWWRRPPSLISVLIALTLLPALLGFAGRR